MLRAAIFDLDGLLVDSEPLWRRAEREVFGSLGLDLSEEDCRGTTGLAVGEVALHWYERHPWPGPEPAAVASTILDRVVDLVRGEAVAKAGAAEALDAARRAGLRLALASGSAIRLVEAAVGRLGLEGAFEVVVSAEGEPLGKPHPGVYLRTAERLGVRPTECVAVEDSIRGVIAAKAARMTCVAVPEVGPDERAPFAVADLVLDSLLDLDEATFRRLSSMG